MMLSRSNWLLNKPDILGQGFASLLHLYSPDVLVMGGGLSNQFEALRPGIMAGLRRSAMAPFRDTPVVRAALGNNSGWWVLRLWCSVQPSGPVWNSDTRKPPCNTGSPRGANGRPVAFANEASVVMRPMRQPPKRASRVFPSAP